ncbi:T9SS type A sorting domain-containing protein [Psychroserpens sp. XS_ASV72]|uniref:T9SS type A sorting domain-containing protein n=1 Tax=Psychroserpens sp. XS_ASV72 TaxID=3241293 RepID=UPI003512C8C2
MKHLLPLFSLIAFFNFTNAQSDLFVSNGSFVFVDGTGFTSDPNVAPLFVTDDVNIQNSGNIYLRNDAQLLQGTGTTGNSGFGELSVFQEGTVNQYAYNYWCSPIGAGSASNGNDDFTVNLIDETTGLISSTDVAFTAGYNSSTGPLTISNRWLFTFIASDEYSEWVYNGESGNINPGLGFTMKGVGTGVFGSQQYDFRGKPNNGTITNTVAAPVGGVDQWTLVGNPYPSALDAADFIHDTQNSSNINGTLYFWEQQPGASSHYIADYVGGYATYTINAAGTVESFTKATFLTYLQDGTPTALPGTISPTTKQVRRYIPIGQGFMVSGTTNGTVRTTNAMREFYKEADTDSEFFRTSEADSNTSDDEYSNSIPDDYKRFRIYVDFNDLYTRELLMNFHSTATDGFDYGLEGRSPEGPASDAYWVLDNVPYVIQAFDFNTDLRIPLVINLDEQMSLRVRIHDIQNFADDQPIYLHDKVNNTYTDLRYQDSNFNLESGAFSERYEITFTNEDTLTTEEISINDFLVFQDNSKEQLTVKNPNLLDVRSVTLYDTSGKQVFHKIGLDNQEIYHFSTKSLSDGIYVTVISTENGNSISKKLVVKNK